MEGEEQDLRSAIAVISRRRWLIGAATAVAVVVAVALSFVQPKRYTARARVLARAEVQDVFNTGIPAPGDAQRVVDTEIEVVRSEPTRAEAAKELGFLPPKVSASAVGRTDLMEVRASAGSPEEAARITNAYAQAYVRLRRAQAVERLDAAAKELETKVADFQRQIEDLGGRLASTPAESPAATGLRSQRDLLLQQQSALQARYVQLQVDASLEDGGARVVSQATPPSSPSSPRPVRNASVAMALGLVFGVGLAFVRDHLDDSVKTREDLEAVIEDLPLIGSVPRVKGWDDADGAFLVSLADPHSPAADAYRSLAVALRAGGVGEKFNVVQVTSSVPGEGKSSTVANLGVALAQAGVRVVAISADLHRPRLHHFFDTDNDRGLTTVLSGTGPIQGKWDTFTRVPGVNHLILLNAGSPPRDGHSNLLGSPRMKELLDVLRTSTNVVLIDSPPVLGVSDAAVLARVVDATILVASVGVAGKAQVRRSVELLRSVDADLLGVVLNNTDELETYAYYYRRAGGTDAAAG